MLPLPRGPKDLLAKYLAFAVGLMALAAISLSCGVSGAVYDYQWSKQGIHTTGVVTGYLTGGEIGTWTLAEAASLEGVEVLVWGRVGSVGEQISFTYRPDRVANESVTAEVGDTRNKLWLGPALIGLVIAGGAAWWAVSLIMKARAARRT